MAKLYKTFDEAKSGFQRADLLLARPTTVPGKVIKTFSGFEHSHAAMLAWRNDREWVVLDMLQWRGGSSRPLRKEIEKYPGAWEHFRVNTARFPEFDRERAELRMWQFDDTDYAWGALAKAAFMFAPGIRLFQKIEAISVDNGDTVNTVDKDGNEVSPIPAFCSMAYCLACDKPFGGVDPVRHLRHSMTTPGHLAQSHLFEYQCTLVTEEWRRALAEKERRAA